MAARSKKNVIQLGTKEVAVYASPKISAALDIVVEDMNLVQGVKLAQVMEAVYEQGKKDGARTAFEAITAKFQEAQAAIPHRNPGKPKKTKAAAKKTKKTGKKKSAAAKPRKAKKPAKV